MQVCAWRIIESFQDFSKRKSTFWHFTFPDISAYNSIFGLVNKIFLIMDRCYVKSCFPSWKNGYNMLFLHLHRGSYMSAHVLLNLLNKLKKRDKMWGLPSILSLFRNEFNKFNNTGARMLGSIYHMTFKIILKSYFGVKTLGFCHIFDIKSVIS